MDSYCLCDVLDEINDYLIKNGEYLIFYKDELVQDLAYYIKKYNKENTERLKEKVKNLSEEEEQIKLFNSEKDKQKTLVYSLLDILDTLDKNIVMKGLKEYEYIK